MTIHGVDVSAYQSETYSTAGLDFVFTKVTEGLSYINPRWTKQRDRAKTAGLVWGAYHYPHMANDPIKEADYFLKQVAWKPGDIIVLDWEGYDSSNTSVPKSRQIAYRDAWLKYVKGKMPGHRVGMYCNTDYWRNVDKTSNCGDFLWIATAGATAGNPGINHAWTFHQYSTAGGIDHDVANFPSRAALAAWAAGGTNQPEEDDVALTADDIDKIADAVIGKIFSTDNILKAPEDASDYKTNKFWTFGSHVEATTTASRSGRTEANKALTDLKTQVSQVAAKVSAISVGGVDLDALADKVADKLAARLAQ